MIVGDGHRVHRANVRMAIVLAIVAVAFYVGILLLKHS